MAKVIKYKFLSAEINHGTEEEPNIEQVILDVEIPCSTQAQYDANLPIAEKEAIPGTLDPDLEGEFDTPELDTTPTLEERVGTVEDDVADLSEALDMILNEVTE